MPYFSTLRSSTATLRMRTWTWCLNGADLTDANLKNVRGLTAEQVRSARYWYKAQYDQVFARARSA